MTTDPRIAVLAALSSPSWHPVPEAHGMPWDEAVALLAAYDASRAAVPVAPSAPTSQTAHAFPLPARAALIAYTATARTVTAAGLLPLLDAHEVEVRAATLREAAEALIQLRDRLVPEPDITGNHLAGIERSARELRRLAAEAPEPATQADAQADEDPARVDRLRPEFTDHASVESIDAQLRRARSQERRWHLRVEWLISLRSARVEQKARGEWPADGRCAACGHTVCDGEGPCGARSGDDFCTCPGPAAVPAVGQTDEEA